MDGDDEDVDMESSSLSSCLENGKKRMMKIDGDVMESRQSSTLSGRVILILVFEFFCHGHTYKLFHFVHWFQNCFLFRSQALRSSGGKSFRSS